MAATALLGGLIAMFLKREAGEIALLLSIATTVLLLVLVGSAAVEILSLLRSLAQQASISDALLTPMLKVLGIEVVTNLAAHICKDAGEGDLAPVACLQEGAAPCKMAAECKTLPVWQGYYDMTRDYFSNITLADLMKAPMADNYVI